MASVATTFASETMSNPPVFSYAQAARGQTVATSITAPPDIPTSVAPSPGSLGKDDSASATILPASSAAPSSVASDTQEHLPKALQESVDLSNMKTVDSELSSVIGSVGSSGAMAGCRDDVASAAGSQSNAGEKTARSQASTSRAGDMQDTRKPRKGGKNSKNSEKNGGDQELNKENLKAFEPAKVELAEAPIPAVNVWHERAAATAKRAASLPKPPTSLTAATSTADAPVTDATKAAEPKKQGPPAESASESGMSKASPAGPGSKPPKKSGETSRPGSDGGPRRNAPRGSRLPGKDERSVASAAPPPVQDPSLWPSIEPAAAEDGKKKSTTQEKVEPERVKQQEESGATRPRPKKEWAPLPVDVTSYTPLDPHGPHSRHPRTRGGGRGGRETGTRGGHHPTSGAAATEKDSLAATTVTTNKASAEPRERPRDTTTLPSRPTTQASAAAKRGPSDSAARETRKVPGVTSSEKPKSDFNGPPFPSRGEAPPRAARPDFVNGEQAPNSRRQSSDHRREPRGPHDIPLDAAVSHGGRGEGRSERGRGGYRGRGGHNNMGGHHQHQPGYGPNGQRFIGGGGLPLQQNQAPFSPTTNPYGGNVSQPFSHGNGRRGPPRSQTGPAHGGGQRAPNGNHLAGPARMPTIPLPPTHMDFHPMQHVHQAYQPQVWATPGQPGQPPNAEEVIISSLRQQVEYYLSFENLHRDHYLRARMDSQGWVLLKTMAEFHRLKSLAPNFNFIRTACELSKEIDYIVGDDNEDRVRSRGDVGQLILPDMESRAEEARSSGPTIIHWRSLDRLPGPYVANGFGHHAPWFTASPTTFPEFPRNGGDHFFPGQSPIYPVNGGHFAYGGAVMNGGGMNGASINGAGINGHAYVNGHRFPGESQLSAAVPDFSPIAHQRPSLDAFQQFQDVDIPKLNVILDGNKAAGAAGVINGVSPSAAEDTAAENVTTANAVSEQSLPNSAPSNSAPYPGFREEALDQREKAAPGETPAAMHNLYKFWVDVLSNTFNVKLYEEFRRLAMDDGSKNPACPAGLRYLLSFYNSVFSVKRLYPREFDAHYEEAKRMADLLSAAQNGAMYA